MPMGGIVHVRAALGQSNNSIGRVTILAFVAPMLAKKAQKCEPSTTLLPACNEAKEREVICSRYQPRLGLVDGLQVVGSARGTKMSPVAQG